MLLSERTKSSPDQAAHYLPTENSAPDLTLGLSTTAHPLRQQLERYIAARYAHRHQATIKHFLPHLLVLEKGSQPRAVLSLRSARQQPLFLECYLDKPLARNLTALSIAVR